MIVAEQLRKTFPARGKDKTPVVAVDDVGFTARDGEITGLLGPNGAGKTTTLRMLYTLMSPERGRVLVDGVDVAGDPERVRRSLGVLPDARGVYKRLTARENITYFGELHGLSAATIAERTARLSAALQMDDFLDRATEGFSQGQRTKTAITLRGSWTSARAIAVLVRWPWLKPSVERSRKSSICSAPASFAVRCAMAWSDMSCSLPK